MKKCSLKFITRGDGTRGGDGTRAFGYIDDSGPTP